MKFTDIKPNPKDYSRGTMTRHTKGYKLLTPLSSFDIL
jgi:hypothetical protein